MTCARPDYLRTAPAIDSPAALRDHACITLASQGRHWYYRHDGKELAEPIAPRLMCNQIRAASLACVQGLGVTRLMHYQVADELADGRLVRILREFEPGDLPIQLVYPHSLQLSPRVRAFVEWAGPRLERRCRILMVTSACFGRLQTVTPAVKRHVLRPSWQLIGVSCDTPQLIGHLHPFEHGACVGSPMRNMADNNKLIKGAPDVGGAGR